MVFMVGNKTDLDKRQVSAETAEKFAQDKGYPFMETSAKTGTSTHSWFFSATPSSFLHPRISSPFFVCCHTELTIPVFAQMMCTGENVEELFSKLAQAMVSRYTKTEARPATSTLNLGGDDAPPKKKKGCTLF